ncbi:MAG: hypothetical protein ABI670_01070 [Chloroflexota bacterium]
MVLAILKERIPGGRNKLITLGVLLLLSVVGSLYAVSVYVVSDTPPEIPMFPGARLIESHAYLNAFSDEHLITRRVMEVEGDLAATRGQYEGMLTYAGWGSQVLTLGCRYDGGDFGFSVTTVGKPAHVRQKNDSIGVVDYFYVDDDTTNIQMALYKPFPVRSDCNN